MPSRAPARLLLAADVGGTHARVGLVSAQQGRALHVLHYQKYVCAEHADMADVLADFLDALRAKGVDLTQLSDAVVACAGYVLDDTIVNVNLPWPVAISAMRERLGLRRLDVINDFEALAHALPGLDPRSALTLIGRPELGSPQEPMLVMGPGTGLGCAVVLPGPQGPRVLATEAGQIGFAPGNAREAAILAVLSRDREYVAVEHLLSGPGLVNIYRALATLDGRMPTIDRPAEISRRALAQTDPLALEALQILCGVLGSFTADLAILYGASGGVYLAGGFLPKLGDFLLRSTLRERFYRRGVMRAWLEKVPVRLIEHGQLGVLGAASWINTQT